MNEIMTTAVQVTCARSTIRSGETLPGNREQKITALTNAIAEHSKLGEGQKPSLTQVHGKNMLTRRKTSVHYKDGRKSCGHKPNPKCSKIVMSDRALAQIYSETQEKDKDSNETGGLLLGQFIDGVWYIIESSDPGYNGVFRHSYHESDDKYANHVCKILSRIYKYPLNFLGMWHRHPGSMDTFSGTDDVTNTKYAKSTDDSVCKNGCISLLVNKDPNFRLTAYFVEINEGEITYTKTDLNIGDSNITDRRAKEIANQNDIDKTQMKGGL